MNRVLVALGSNQNNPRQQIQAAVDVLSHKFEHIKFSSMYLTQAVGEVEQRSFINAVVSFQTSMSAPELLDFLLGLEQKAGRDKVNEIFKGPRNLDLDIILFGDTICTMETLQIPHPRFRERRFVLEPAAEIAGEMLDPITQKNISKILAECNDPNWVKVLDDEMVIA